MKKMFKAVATLAVGCALLSTSAFAAADEISGTVIPDATGAQVAIEGYETSAQATILVVKDTKVNNTIPENLPDGSIAYINQVAVSDKKASYDVNVTGDGVYSVFAGGSDVATATFINSFEIKSVVNVTSVTLQEGDADAAAEKELAIGATAAFTAKVLPADATNPAVTWTVVANGADVTTSVLAVSEGVATFTAPEVEADTEYVLTATADGESDSIKITVKAPVVEDEAVYLPGANGTVAGVGNVIIKNITNVNKKWWIGFDNGSRKVKVSLDALAAEGAVTANYMIEVVKVSNPKEAVEGAEVFYSAEGKFFVALVPAASNADYQFKVVSGENVNTATVIAKFGEINGRTGVNVLDAAQMSKIALGTASNTLTTNAAVIAADVDNNANLNVTDAATIAKKALGTISKLPILE